MTKTRTAIYFHPHRNFYISSHILMTSLHLPFPPPPTTQYMQINQNHPLHYLPASLALAPKTRQSSRYKILFSFAGCLID